MRKKSKLPDNLYHFTSLIKYRIILESGKLALTPSNLKFDPDTFHYEPIYFREQEIGMQAVDKYKDYHPVVWLTANDQVTAQNTGLSDDKLMCRINIKTGGRFWRYLRWRDFCDKYHADRFATAALKQSASDYANWYICESEIPLADFAKVEFLDQDGLYKEAHQIRKFRLRMWHRSCSRKKNQIKTSNYIAPVYPVSGYTGVSFISLILFIPSIPSRYHLISLLVQQEINSTKTSLIFLFKSRIFLYFDTSISATTSS